MKKTLSGFLIALACAFSADGALRVASLHPLLSDMARSIGGDAVEVVDLFPENGNLHDFAPTAADIAAAAGSRMILACGKGVEPYLNDLRDTAGSGTQIVELGSTVPDVCLPGSTVADPHWWNSPMAMKRAARHLRTVLAQAAPEQKETFTDGMRRYCAQMDTLIREAKLAIASIAPERRVIVSSHASMCHFCKDFGFIALPVHGIAHECEGDTASLAHMLHHLREHKVPCIFIGVNESPRAMQVIASQVGATTQPLVQDGIHPESSSYADMFRFNIRNIVKGLNR